MITKYEQIYDYPEYPEQGVINGFVDFVILHSNNESQLKTLEKLEELADKQYHLYQEPNNEIKEKVKNWIIANWNSPDDKFLESIILIISGFSMEKRLYQVALENYHGENKVEFKLTMANSLSKNIDPWWDLK